MAGKHIAPTRTNLLRLKGELAFARSGYELLEQKREILILELKRFIAREVLAAMNLAEIHSNGYSFQIEMTHTAWHLGFKIVESPIVFEERREGQSKMSGGIINEALWMVWKLLARCGYRRRPRVVHPQSVAAPPPAGAPAP